MGQLPQVKVNLGVMTMKGYSTFSKAPALEHYHQMKVSVISKTLGGVLSYPFAEKQSAYSTASANRADYFCFKYAVDLILRKFMFIVSMG